MRVIHHLVDLLAFFRRLGEEMRNMSMEKNRQREQELVVEIESLQAEIKAMQRTSEDGANISQQLGKEVRKKRKKKKAKKNCFSFVKPTSND